MPFVRRFLIAFISITAVLTFTSNLHALTLIERGSAFCRNFLIAVGKKDYSVSIDYSYLDRIKDPDIWENLDVLFFVPFLDPGNPINNTYANPLTDPDKAFANFPTRADLFKAFKLDDTPENAKKLQQFFEAMGKLFHHPRAVDEVIGNSREQLPPAALAEMEIPGIHRFRGQTISKLRLMAGFVNHKVLARGEPTLASNRILMNTVFPSESAVGKIRTSKGLPSTYFKTSSTLGRMVSAPHKMPTHLGDLMGAGRMQWIRYLQNHNFFVPAHLRTLMKHYAIAIEANRFSEFPQVYILEQLPEVYRARAIQFMQETQGTIARLNNDSAFDPRSLPQANTNEKEWAVNRMAELIWDIFESRGEELKSVSNVSELDETQWASLIDHFPKSDFQEILKVGIRGGRETSLLAEQDALKNLIINTGKNLNATNREELLKEIQRTLKQKTLTTISEGVKHIRKELEVIASSNSAASNQKKEGWSSERLALIKQEAYKKRYEVLLSDSKMSAEDRIKLTKQLDQHVDLTPEQWAKVIRATVTPFDADIISRGLRAARYEWRREVDKSREYLRATPYEDLPQAYEKLRAAIENREKSKANITNDFENFIGLTPDEIKKEKRGSQGKYNDLSDDQIDALAEAFAKKYLEAKVLVDLERIRLNPEYDRMFETNPVVHRAATKVLLDAEIADKARSAAERREELVQFLSKFVYLPENILKGITENNLSPVANKIRADLVRQGFLKQDRHIGTKVGGIAATLAALLMIRSTIYNVVFPPEKIKSDIPALISADLGNPAAKKEAAEAMTTFIDRVERDGLTPAEVEDLQSYLAEMDLTQVPSSLRSQLKAIKSDPHFDNWNWRKDWRSIREEIVAIVEAKRLLKNKDIEEVQKQREKIEQEIKEEQGR